MEKLIIAHRGASRLARENTLLAFQKAIDIGADIIELDVRQTRDGELAVFHDSKIFGKKINGISLAEANRLAASQNFTIPILEQALTLITGKAGLQIEIKDAGYEFETAEAALKYLKPENFFIISFNFKTLKKIKSRFPQINTGLIIGTWHTWQWQMLKFLLQRQAILTTVDLISINLRLWQAGLAKFIPERIALTVWNADEPEIIKRLLVDKSVTSIASNVPDLAIKIKKQIYGTA
ncbi:MAG: glycerophosphodiester phosphodiesterase [Legionella sp.]|uniref:glycerophosphodiester phosphodiesterase n=1 Tax=Legionella sp. TaxID=459 RepID=UPI002843347E|nr:glycerophosphodiester phosphodiesterase [Legionella sp.]